MPIIDIVKLNLCIGIPKCFMSHVQGIRGNALKISALAKFINFANCHKMSKIPRIPWACLSSEF